LPDLVLVPKTESARDIEVAGVLDDEGYTPDIWALIETLKPSTGFRRS
jgi:citrate lyase subunit beta/citryl-CoA lyase/(S)-citramalyl-CoA lyase